MFQIFRCVERKKLLQSNYFVFSFHFSAHRSFENVTTQKMKFSIKYFIGKCYQIRRKLRIWSHLLKKSLMENFIFWAVLCWQNAINIMLKSWQKSREKKRDIRKFLQYRSYSKSVYNENLTFQLNEIFCDLCLTRV